MSQQPEHAQNDDDIIDVEEYGKNGKPIPTGKKYKIRIDKETFTLEVSTMTGREILSLAGKTPPERYRLDEKLRGGATKKIELDQSVDFTETGVERFMTLPLDQTEG